MLTIRKTRCVGNIGRLRTGRVGGRHYTGSGRRSIDDDGRERKSGGIFRDQRKRRSRSRGCRQQRGRNVGTGNKRGGGGRSRRSSRDAATTGATGSDGGGDLAMVVKIVGTGERKERKGKERKCACGGEPHSVMSLNEEGEQSGE